jgi:uncharacterized protein YydD (DUF2326 family)
MAILFNLSGGLDSLQEYLVARIRSEEQLSEHSERLRDQRRHRAYAAGLREALEFVDAAIRSAAPEPTKVPEPVELRRCSVIMTEIEQRATDERDRQQADADRRAAETFGALAEPSVEEQGQEG